MQNGTFVCAISTFYLITYNTFFLFFKLMTKLPSWSPWKKFLEYPFFVPYFQSAF